MAVIIGPEYSSEVGYIELEVNNEEIQLSFFSKGDEEEEIYKDCFDSKSFLKHLKIVSELGNEVSIKSKNNEYNNIKIYSDFTGEELTFTYKDISCQLNKEKIMQIVTILI